MARYQAPDGRSYLLWKEDGNAVGQPTPGLPLDLALTATAIWNAMQATKAPPVPKTGGGGTR